MPHFRQYPMGDVVNANLEPGEYVVRRNAVNALGVGNMELLNHADGAHGALNKLMVSASLVNHQSQDNEPVKTEANGFPIADSPVRQRVDATRQMQGGGPISAESVKGKDEMMMSEEGKPIYKSSQIMSVPASQVGSEGGPRYYLGEDTSIDMMIALEKAQNVARGKMRYSPADSIPAAMVEGYFDEPEAPKKKGRLRSLLGLQDGGPVRGYQEGDLVSKPLSGIRPEEFDYKPTDYGGYDVSGIFSVPAEQVGSEGGPRFYLGEGSARNLSLGKKIATARARSKMTTTPADSIPAAMVESYFDDPDGYKEGGKVKSERQAAMDSLMNTDEYVDLRAEDAKKLQIMAVLDSLNQGSGENVRTPEGGGRRSDDSSGYSPSLDERFNMWEQTGRGVESSRERQLEMANIPSDKYNGEPSYKSAEAYKRAFGMQTPLNAEERFTQIRLGLNPEMFTAQQSGLLGKALLQRLGNEVQ